MGKLSPFDPLRIPVMSTDLQYHTHYQYFTVHYNVKNKKFSVHSSVINNKHSITKSIKPFRYHVTGDSMTNEA